MCPDQAQNFTVGAAAYQEDYIMSVEAVASSSWIWYQIYSEHIRKSRDPTIIGGKYRYIWNFTPKPSIRIEKWLN